MVLVYNTSLFPAWESNGSKWNTHTHTFINIGTHTHACARINKTKLIFWEHIYFLSCFCHGLCLLLTSMTRWLPCTYVVPTCLLASSLSIAASKSSIWYNDCSENGKWLCCIVTEKTVSQHGLLKIIQVLPSWSREVVVSEKFSRIISWFTDLESRPEVFTKTEAHSFPNADFTSYIL